VPYSPAVALDAGYVARAGPVLPQRGHQPGQGARLLALLGAETAAGAKTTFAAHQSAGLSSRRWPARSGSAVAPVRPGLAAPPAVKAGLVLVPDDPLAVQGPYRRGET